VRVDRRARGNGGGGGERRRSWRQPSRLRHGSPTPIHTPTPQTHNNTALKRKGKGSDVSEEQMDSVVRAHNSECFYSGVAVLAAP
jgi:hypothetical protein